MRTTQPRWGRTMMVRTDHLAKVGLLGIVLHMGVTIGRRSNPPIIVRLPPPLKSPAKIEKIETTTARAQPLAPSTAMLPPLHERLPKIGTPQFDRRVRRMGLDPKEVEKFALMMRTQDLRASRE